MRRLIGLLLALTALSGCAALNDAAGRRQGASSSLVDYLYPNGERPPARDDTVPTLTLPLRVGIAFVPSRDASTPGLSELHKNELLGKVKAAFADRPFIRDIQIVPDAYLRSRRGFQTVDQVARLYGFDVIALVSYDQVVHTEDTKAALLYWTIVGAYLIPGSKNDVQTFVDAAIFDVKTRKLLLRAPGIDRIESTSTLVNVPEERRKARERSFDLALADMTRNLDHEIDAFRERIRSDRSVNIARVANAAGTPAGGGGAIAFMPLVVLATIALALKRTRRPQAPRDRSAGDVPALRTAGSPPAR